MPGSDLAARVTMNAAFTTLQGSVCESTLKGITDMGFTQMTEIQARTIPPLLEGRSVNTSVILIGILPFYAV